MVWIFCVGSASLLSFLCFLFLPIDIALPLNGAVTVFTLLFLSRQYGMQTRLARLSAMAGCKKGTSQGSVVEAVSDRLSSQTRTLAQVVAALDHLAERADDDAPITIDGEAGEALRSFRKKLADVKVHEQRQHWAAKGMAALNEIKKNNHSRDEYAYQAISTLVKYVNANQASFYLLTENAEQLQLLATYAYHKRRYTDGVVLVHRDCGLLGQCINERDIIYITALPANYIKITSGLGEASPRALIVIPMIYRDQIYGVIEMASFHTLEPYQIDFCRKFTEGVAAELSGLQIHDETSKLLEQAQSQADQLKSQEEVLRQHMEEMAATQEEMARKEIALREKMGEIDDERSKHEAILQTCADAVVSFDGEGRIQFANKAAAEMFGYNTTEIRNRSVYRLLDFEIVYAKDGSPQLITKTGNTITSRTEVNAIDGEGNPLSLLLTVSQVSLKGKPLFTMFAQKISVDLF